MSRDATLQLVRSSLPPELRHRVHSGRELGRSRRREASKELFPTPLEPLNRLLAGGPARGELVEWVGRRSCGSFSTLLTTLAGVTRGGRVAALVDLGDGFSPRAAEAAGTCPERLLWVRPRRLRDALAAAEILLTGDFPFVAMDLGPSAKAAGRGAQSAWVRLARTARERRAALWVFTPHRVSGTAADTVIEARPRAPLWDRSRRGVALLQGIRSELVLRKRPGTAPGSRETLAFHVDSPRAKARVSEALLSEPGHAPSEEHPLPLRRAVG